MSAPSYDEARPLPAVELRTSLGLAALAAGLTHVMAAAHSPSGLWPAGAPFLVMAVVQGASAAGLAFSPARWVLAPAAALNLTIALVWLTSRARGLPVGLGDILGTVAELLVAGGAVALLSGAGDRTLSVWSKTALAVFALAAFTGFGHVGH
jgi:hypothetical protein